MMEIEAQVGQKLLTWIRLIMICYIVPWWPSWLYHIKLPLAIQNLMLFEEFQDCHHGCYLGYWNWMIQQFWISISLWCLPSSFGSTWLTVWEEMWFEEFQDGGHLGHWNRRILAILNFRNTPMPPIMFKLIQTFPSVADVIWRFSRWHRGGHLGYWNGTILAILDLCVTLMPPEKFWLNLT